MRGRQPRTLTPIILLTLLTGANAATLPITAHVAQSGALAGIRNTLFTTWLPRGQAFAGLSGHITLAGNHPGFSEALVMLGYANDGQAACTERNGKPVAGMPTLTRLWAGILKSNDGEVGIPVAVTLPVPIPPPDAAGACLTTLISAGYPFLRRRTPLYTTTDAQLSVITRPPSRPVLAFGIGGEFKLASGSSTSLFTYAGVRAERPMTLEGIAASISAAPVLGAPPQAGWGEAPAGPWRVTTTFVLVPKPACAAARFSGHAANAHLSVLRLATPGPASPPPGSIVLRQVTLASANTIAVQAAPSEPMSTAPFGLHLNPGDCLIAFQGAPPGGPPGRLDVESQSTAYLADDPQSP